MVLQRRERKPRLAHNLREHVEGLGSVLPLFPIKIGPFSKIRQGLQHSGASWEIVIGDAISDLIQDHLNTGGCQTWSATSNKRLGLQ
jgi:hypothetical protein